MVDVARRRPGRCCLRRPRHLSLGEVDLRVALERRFGLQQYAEETSRSSRSPTTEAAPTTSYHPAPASMGQSVPNGGVTLTVSAAQQVPTRTSESLATEVDRDRAPPSKRASVRRAVPAANRACAGPVPLCLAPTCWGTACRSTTCIWARPGWYYRGAPSGRRQRVVRIRGAPAGRGPSVIVLLRLPCVAGAMAPTARAGGLTRTPLRADRLTPVLSAARPADEAIQGSMALWRGVILLEACGLDQLRAVNQTGPQEVVHYLSGGSGAAKQLRDTQGNSVGHRDRHRRRRQLSAPLKDRTHFPCHLCSRRRPGDTTLDDQAGYFLYRSGL